MIRGGRSFVSSAPAFSNDAKRLLVCTGDAVSIFSTSTGLQVASLDGHAALVTSIVVVPPSGSNPASRALCYCWTASLDGTIRYWDFSVPELMKTVDVQLPIFSMVIPALLTPPSESSGRQPDLYAYISIENIKEQEKPLRGQIKKCNLTKSSLLGSTLKETKKPKFITLSPSGKFFSILDNRKLHIWRVPDIESDHSASKKITLHHTKPFTILAFHHTQRILAAGDVTGRILIWRGFGNRTFLGAAKSSNGDPMDYEEERPGVRGNDDADSCSTWHWHPTEVNALSFSSDGAYLYSGGREGVLVVWQLDTGKRKYLPRIGSPLLYFVDSPDPSLASISCADNQIHLLKMPAMEILKSISGIKLPSLAPEAYYSFCGGFAFDHNAGIVALRTENYGIQFYSLFDDCGISEVPVCERNHHPGDEITVIVTKVALSWDGSLMGTAEVKLPEEDIGRLVCLKFWTSRSQKKEFRLSTVIYEPHRESDISALAFRPTQAMAVTTSYGGDFKIWVCKDAIHQKDQADLSYGWICHSFGSYKKKPLTAAAFSSDGSVLAVAAETTITLWDPDRNILVALVGDTFSPTKNLTFISQSGLILSASRGSKSQLCLWNLLTMSKEWSLSLQVEDVACTGETSMFAVLALIPLPAMQSSNVAFIGRDGVILVFDAKNPVPVASWSVRKAEGGGLAFVQPDLLMEGKPDGEHPHWLLAFVNGDHEYVLFDPLADNVDENRSKRRKPVSVEESENFGYTSMYGELPEFDVKRDREAEVTVAPSERPWETIFSGTSHNLPPLTKLCSAFLESLLQMRPAAAE